MPDAQTNKKVAVPRAEAPRVNPAHAEHIFIGSDESPDPRTAGRTVRKRWRLANPLRRELTEVTLFEEGYLEIVEHARGGGAEAFRLDLRYLDPIPSISRFIAKRAWWTTAGCAAAALGTLALSSLGPLVVSFGSRGRHSGARRGRDGTAPQPREDRVLHDPRPRARPRARRELRRDQALSARSCPRSAARSRKSAETIARDTSAYLRAEMREHYRLRGRRRPEHGDVRRDARAASSRTSTSSSSRARRAATDRSETARASPPPAMM